MNRLAGKVALITGAAGGQGAVEARLFVEEGATVVLTDVAEDAGRALADELGDAASFHVHDVSSEADWERIVEAIRAEHGRLDVLVNNAGILDFGPIVGQDAGSFMKVQEVNVLGTLLGMKHGARLMADGGGGSIVNISSISGMQGSEYTVAYTASKFAIRGMTKVAAIELGPKGIRVNSVHPGGVDTPMVRGDGMLPPGVASWYEKLPLGRVGQPEDVAPVVLFLASDDSRYCTGAEILVDGGACAGDNRMFDDVK